MKIVIYYSINRGNGGTLNKKLTGCLARSGYTSQDGRTFHNLRASEADLAEVFAEFWKIAGSHKGVARIEQFWSHIEERDPSHVRSGSHDR